MVEWLKSFSKSILAGCAISIGAMVFVGVGGGWIGATLFSIGLYLVLWYGLNLYTGKVGYANSFKDIVSLIIIFIGNLIGCALSFATPFSQMAADMAAAKLALPLWLVFVKAIICGILIYAGVDQYKKQKQYAPIIAVPAFILAGAEHCIADICYFIMARTISIEVIVFILVVVIGNAIGSLLWRFLS